MKDDKKGEFSTAPFVVCILVKQGEESLLRETLESVTAESAVRTPVFVFLPPDVAANLSGFDRCRSITVPAPSLRAIVETLPAEYARHDLLLVQAGTRVPASWDARLRWTAYTDPRIATVSPMCNEMPAFSILNNGLLQQSDLETLNRVAYWKGLRKTYEAPFFLPACVYIKREALQPFCSSEKSAVLEAPWNTSHALNTNGRLNVVCDHVVVSARPDDPVAQALSSTDAIEIPHFLRHHPFGGLRQQAVETIKRRVQLKPIPGIKERVVQLHAMHAWGGGLEKWVQSYCRADKTRTNLILKPAGEWGAFGQALLLYDHVDAKEPIARWDFSHPIRATAIAHLEYRQALSEIIQKFGVDYILISSLIGHSLDALRTGVDTAIVCHDYHPFCPAITIHFNEVCTQCDSSRLACCFQQNEMNRFFRNLTAEDWIPLRNTFTELVKTRPIQFIAPTDSAREHLTTLQPALAGAPFTTVAHGMEQRFPIRRENRSKPGEKLRVVILGSLALQKGYHLFKATYKELLNYADLFLVGCGDEGMEFQQDGILVIRSYKHEELPALLERISPDCGLLLSIWPETFSYTLSELMQFGIPPVATSLGAFRNKIRNGVNGILFEPSAACLVQVIQSLHQDRTPLERIESELRNVEHRTLEQMVADYHTLLPEKKFSPIRYENADRVIEFKTATKKSFRREFKKYVRQQIKTPTLLAMKRRVVRWMKISRTIPPR